MDRLDFVVLILGIGVKELHLINLSWRSAVIPTIAALALLSGQTTTLQACCGWFGGGWFDGGWGAGYAPYSAGYYGGGYGYASYYAPAYSSGCDPCGCGPACGYGCGSCNLACAGCYGPGCATCVGGNCNINLPANSTSDPTRPAPDDGFRSVPNDRNRTPPPDPNANDTDRPPRRRNTFDDSTDDPTTAPRDRSRRNDGVDDSRGNRAEPETEPATNNDSFESELTPRTNRNSPDRFESNRVSTDEPADGTSKSAPPPDDSIDGGDESSSKTNKPDLGKPVPGDTTIIPGRKKAAPTDAEEKSLKIELPDEIQLDEKSTSHGIAPKTRLAITGRYGTPKIVRLKLRPTSKWLADPQQKMIARH
jgi:hypothetical protein